MMTFTADGGRKLGVSPTVLVVPPAVEEAALNLLNTEYGAAGASNPWKGTAQPIVTPYLGIKATHHGCFEEDIRAAHRRAHRMGNPAKIDADPGMRGCIIARIDPLTFDQIAAQVTAAFPPNRGKSRSSLHRWCQKWAGRTGGATC